MSVKPTFASIDEEDEIVDLSNPEVVRKYKAAAEVAHRLSHTQLVLGTCTPPLSFAHAHVFTATGCKAQAPWRR